MPKTTAEKLTPTRAKLSVEVTLDELEPYLKQAYKTISEQVSIPGFRKGKVPAPIIDQRVGREAVIQEAVNHSLDDFYQAALAESDERPMGRPTADVASWPDAKDPKSTLGLVFEVEVRPEFTLPNYDGITLTVDNAEVDEAAVDAELLKLRERFGTLVTVDRPAKTGDFVELDLVATVDGEEVDQAQGVSYEVGAGNLLEGTDEAVETLTAGESTTFSSQLLGGEHEGRDAEVSLTLTAVKERELPEADDEFAQLASEFDTIAELRESLKDQAARASVFAQGQQARDLFTETLIEQAGIPVSEELVEEEVHRHLEGEGRLEDDEHRAEVRVSSEKQIQLQLLLDAIVEAEEVTPTQNELSQYIFQSAQQYGMEPTQFLQAISQGNQMGVILGEVTRNKALAIALAKANVVDQNGKAVDLSEFTAVDTEDEGAEDEAEATEAAAEEKPAKKAPAKKAAAKKAPKAEADDAEVSDEEAAKKAARSAAAKKAAATRAAKKAAAEAAE
ncbi:trigger factor [Leucobacter chromiireducens]|uniref:Trigger factor n=1 Tax=Leucobacter chromiireducens subsp. chromiireducens TaxID=660067 RepID=A0ABS1SR40_9MICO|nr:trigger factor [Leucobacter chromiireducens]MBL3690615.1 trigger factor [Leucobacter chromiireducens subsp. chromiireducens]